MKTLSGWPFPVLMSGDPRNGGPLDIRIEPDDANESSAVLHSIFESFVPVANAGGFGAVPAYGGRSGTPLAVERRPGTHPAELVWHIPYFGIDYRSLSVLLSAIEGTEERVRRVTVHAPGGGTEPMIRVGDCPPQVQYVPFELTLDYDRGSVRVEIEFGGRLDTETAAAFKRVLEYWADIGVLGGFRRPGAATAGESVLYPMEDVDVLLDAFSFTLPDTTASGCAFVCLVNMLATLSETVARIDRVTIE